MIEVRNLTRKYGSFTAVNSISFSIPKGQIVGLLGHNGAGKTTTLKMLTGYLEATAGDVVIAGKHINEHRLSIQSRIGYLPENSPLYPEMTVVQYLDYVAQMRDLTPAAIGPAIRDAIAATDLGPKASERIDTLSKGYRQRVGVAQAIIHKPDILILDEPTNGLDPTQIAAMRKLIKDLSKTSTVILSTHIMQEVEAICDRVLIVLDGRLTLDSMLADLQRGSTITLALKAGFEEVKSALASIRGVKAISPLSPANGINKFCIEPESSDHDLVPNIAKTVVNKGWNLYSLHEEQRDLETVFREVNRASRPAANGSARKGGVAHV